MSLASPWMLVWLAGVPALVVGYVWMLRLRAARAGRLASEGLVQTAASGRVRWRRHIPFVLFAGALALLCVGLARPAASWALPERQGTVILAFDVSNSMRADDLEPNRIEAAKQAAATFVERQPRTIRIGIVSFGDGALTVLRPSNVEKEVLAAIKRLSVGGGTSLGQGLFTALSAIAGKRLAIDQQALERDDGQVNIGFFGSAAIVLLSDGENTSRLDPVRLAEVASTAGVNIHAIGVGTTEGSVIEIDGFQIATALDEALLTRLAEVTDGTYQRAGDAETLNKIYDSIDLEFKRVEEPRELTALFAAAGGLLLAVGSGLSIAWFGRVI
jgi:Ca-activated chloride channel family protein